MRKIFPTQILFCLYWIVWLGEEILKKNNFLIACKYLWIFLYKEFPISKLFELKIDIKLLEVVSILKVFLMVGKLFVNIHENYCIIDDNPHRYCHYYLEGLEVNNSEFTFKFYWMLYLTWKRNKSMKGKCLLNSCCISNADIFVASI